MVGQLPTGGVERQPPTSRVSATQQLLARELQHPIDTSVQGFEYNAFERCVRLTELLSTIPQTQIINAITEDYSAITQGDRAHPRVPHIYTQAYEELARLYPLVNTSEFSSRPDFAGIATLQKQISTALTIPLRELQAIIAGYMRGQSAATSTRLSKNVPPPPKSVRAVLVVALTLAPSRVYRLQ